MPDKDYLHEGKYGDLNSYQLYLGNQSELITLFGLMGKTERQNDMVTFVNDVMMQGGVETLNENVEGLNGKQNALRAVGDSEKYILEWVKNVKKEIDEELSKIKSNPDHPLKPFEGVFQVVSSSLDTHKGKLTEMLMDSPYIPGIRSAVTTNTLKKDIKLYKQEQNKEADQEENLEEVFQLWKEKLSDHEDAETKEKVPYSYIKNLNDHVAILQEMEFEKQRLLEGYTPEQEKEYLNRLSAAIKSYSDNMNRFRAFAKTVVQPNGTSKYDQYLQNRFDMYTGAVQVQGDNCRHTHSEQGWLDGVRQAIENGWGLKDMDILGAMESALVHEQDLLEQFLINKKLKDVYSEFEKNNEKYNRLAEQLNQAADQLEKEKNKGKKADRKIVTDLENKTNDLLIQMNQVSQDISAGTAQMGENAEQIEKYRSSIQSLKLIKADAWNKNVANNETEKRRIADSLYGVLNDIKNKKNGDEAEIGIIQNMIRPIVLSPYLKGRQKKELPKDLLTESFKREQESVFILNTAGSSVSESVIKAKYPAVYNEIYDKTKRANFYSVLEGHASLKNDKKKLYTRSSPARGILEVSVNRYLKPEETKVVRGWLASVHDSYSSFVSKLPEEEAVFKPYYQLFQNALDLNKGSFLDACIDNQIVRVSVGLMNFGPRIFGLKDKDGNWKDRHDEVKASLAKDGTLLPMVSLYSGLNDVLVAEYEKQADMKAGWDSRKESRYYSRLSLAYEKIIKAHEELSGFSDYIQNKNGINTEDAIRDITGMGDGSERAPVYMIDAMKWELQGMKNGWHAEHIAVMRSLGMIEGALKKSIKDKGILLEKTEKAADKEKLTDEIEKLKLFYKLKLLPFKKTVWNTKINSPEDVIDVLNQADAFTNDAKADPFAKEAMEPMINSVAGIMDACNNKVIRDVELFAGDKQSWRKPAVLGESSSALDERRESILDSVRDMEKPLSVDEMKSLLVTYISSGIINHIENHDPNMRMNLKEYNGKYNSYVNYGVEKYANEFVDRLAKGKENGKFTMSGKEFADCMKYGHHELFYGDIVDVSLSQYDKSRLNYFMAGKFERDEKGRRINRPIQVSLTRARNDIYKEYAYLSALPTPDDVGIFAHSLAEISTEKSEMDQILKKKIDTKSDAVIDPKKYDAFCEKVSQALEKSKKYTKAFAKKEKQNGKLSDTDQKRYKAMKNAENTLTALAKGLNIFRNKGPRKTDFENMEKKFGLETSAIKPLTDCRRINAYTLYSNNYTKALNLMDQETKKCVGLSASPKENRQKIAESALKMVYLASLKRVYGNMSGSQGKMDAAAQAYNTRLEEFENNDGNSPEFNQFKEIAFSNETFKEAFESAVMDSIKYGQFNNAKIASCRDEAMKTAMWANGDDMAKINELDQLAHKIGSPVKAIDLGIKSNSKPKEIVKKVVRRVEEKKAEFVQKH